MNKTERKLFQEKLDKIRKLEAENAVLKHNAGLSMDWAEVDGERVYTKPTAEAEIAKLQAYEDRYKAALQVALDALNGNNDDA